MADKKISQLPSILGSAVDDAADVLPIVDSSGTATSKITRAELLSSVAAIDVTGNITVGGTVDGRDVADDGTKLDGIEGGADVTDATNVAAAGAIMSGTASVTETDLDALDTPSDGEVLSWDTTSGQFEWVAVSGGGTSIALDLGDTGVNDSSALTEIATTGDTNSIFSEPTADKLLIDAGQNWPTADLANSLSAGALDAITEISAGLKTGADGFIVTGTSGVNGNFVSWNVDGDAVDSGSSSSDFALSSHTHTLTDITDSGSMASQNSTSVSITGGSISGITDLAIADGGTGASSASAARSNLGLAIGSDVQAHDAQLDDIAALSVTDGNFIVADGLNWVAESGATARTSLGLGGLATKSTVAAGDIDADAVTESKLDVLDTPADGEVLSWNDTSSRMEWVTVSGGGGGAETVAWVNFNGTGTVAIRESFNVSSITDNGTGSYTVNFATAMADANYAVTASTVGQTNSQRIMVIGRNTSNTTSACHLNCNNTNGVEFDCDSVSVAVIQ